VVINISEYSSSYLAWANAQDELQRLVEPPGIVEWSGVEWSGVESRDKCSAWLHNTPLILSMGVATRAQRTLAHAFERRIVCVSRC
jgi:hypothetical protein